MSLLLNYNQFEECQIGRRHLKKLCKYCIEGIHLQGCFFHYAQNIWRKLQKLDIANLYHSNGEFRKLVRALMNLPFLPVESILPVSNLIYASSLNIVGETITDIRNFLSYIGKQWIRRTPANELSIFSAI